MLDGGCFLFIWLVDIVVMRRVDDSPMCSGRNPSS